MSRKIVIIGGSDAGISAAVRIRELDVAAEPHLIVADEYPNFSLCGLPFYLSGEVADWRSLAHRTRDEIESRGIQLHLEEVAIAIDTERKQVFTRTGSGRQSHRYDALIVATGADPIRPPIPGIDSENVFVLHTMEDSFTLHSALKKAPRSAIIVGGGYIGLEMADALRHRNIAVTLIEALPTVLRTVDEPIGRRAEELLRAHGVSVHVNATVTAIEQNGDALRIVCDGTPDIVGDVVLVVVGVKPQSDIVRGCDIATNQRGAILVDRLMRTNREDIFAAGDCAVTWNRLLERDLYMPLGTTSHKQGRVAGENAVGGEACFAGSIGTQSVKLFDHVFAGTGLRESEAANNGFIPFAAEITTYDHKAYYPGASELVVRIVGDLNSGRLLGGQLVGKYGSEVSKRVDVLATAIYNRMRVVDLNELDLSYTPPLSSPWDPIQMAAQHWSASASYVRRRHRHGRFRNLK